MSMLRTMSANPGQEKVDAPAQAEEKFAFPLPFVLFRVSKHWAMATCMGEGDLLYSVH